MKHAIAREIRQQRPFTSPEQEVMLGLRLAADRVIDPWKQFIKARADLTNGQYNVLRILRGSHPRKFTAGEIVERMIARDPDVTRLVDRLVARGLAVRERSERDRRVVETGITHEGLALLAELDPHAKRLPKALVGPLGASRVKQLATLLNALIEEMGAFP
jgi:DNA-binding MarR family transcriptional regulator